MPTPKLRTAIALSLALPLLQSDLASANPRVGRAEGPATTAALTAWLAPPAHAQPAKTTTASESITSATSQTDGQLRQPASIAVDQSAVQPAILTNVDWLSLGVYEIKPAASALPSGLLQLSVDHGGLLSGVYIDQLTGVSQNVTGCIDQTLGIARWSFDENRSTAFTAGVADLTRTTGQVTLHLPGGEQQLVLERTDSRPTSSARKP